MAKIVLALCALMIAMGFLGHSVNAASSTGGSHVPPTRTCFPSIEWNADQALRPCVKISHVYEDGSFKFAVSDHDGTVRYSGGVGATDR
jgi:hypothetical protein